MALTHSERLNTQYPARVIGGHNYTGPLTRRGQEAKLVFAVIDRDLLAPPGSPAEGDHYIMPATGSPTGAWAGFTNNSLAAYHAGAWVNFAAAEGMLADIADEDIVIRFATTEWRNVSGLVERRNVAVANAATSDLFDAATAGKYHHAFIVDADDPNVRAEIIVLGGAAPVVELASELIGVLELTNVGTVFQIRNLSGLSQNYNIATEEWF